MLWGNDNKKRCKPSKNGLQRSFLAPPAGFEPVACRLGGDRSIQLSYGGLYRKYSILQDSRIRTIRFLGELYTSSFCAFFMSCRIPSCPETLAAQGFQAFCRFASFFEVPSKVMMFYWGKLANVKFFRRRPIATFRTV